MTHDDIQRQDTVDAYVTGRLSEADRRAFEEHCFACDECFAHLQEVQRFSDAVRDAAQSGALPALGAGGSSPEFSWGWMRPAFYLACAATVTLAAALTWLLAVERPRMQLQAAQQKRLADQARQELAMANAPPRAPSAEATAQSAPLLLVMLEASRASTAAVLQVPRGHTQVALWVEPPPAPVNSIYRMEIERGAGKASEFIGGLLRNSYGALAVTVPLERLPSGATRVRLFLERAGGTPELVGEYRLDLRR